MATFGNTLTELETKLREYYGSSTFDQKLAVVLPESKSRLGALNSLNAVKEQGAKLEGAYLGKGVRRGKTQNIVTAWFKVLDTTGRTRRIYLHDLEFAEKLPEEPPILTGLRWTGLEKSLIVSKDSATYRTTTTATFVTDDTIDFGLKALSTFKEALETKKTNPDEDPNYIVLGEIANVNVGEDKEKQTKWIRAEVEDVEGTRMNVNLAGNLKDLFGDQDWLDDYEEVAQNLYHMPVLMQGRIFEFARRDGTQGFSFVVKGGWIADVTKLSEKFQEKLQKLAM